MIIKTEYFDEASAEHSEKVLGIVKDYIKKNPHIMKIVVATTEGATGALFAESIADKEVLVVTHQTGFRKPNHQELKPEFRTRIAETGTKILTTTHAFAGVPRGVRKALGTYEVSEIIAYAYRTFGQGTKVCAEIAMMVADAGLVNVDDDIICVGGTGRGADTAWIIKPANTDQFTDLKMRGCLCKPLKF